MFETGKPLKYRKRDNLPSLLRTYIIHYSEDVKQLKGHCHDYFYQF